MSCFGWTGNHTLKQPDTMRVWLRMTKLAVVAVLAGQVNAYKCNGFFAYVATYLQCKLSLPTGIGKSGAVTLMSTPNTELSIMPTLHESMVLLTIFVQDTQARLISVKRLK